MPYNAIQFDLSNRIATITLNRPDRLNAINEEMRDDFSRLFAELQTNEDIGVVIFTGAGRAFSAGGDIEYFERDWPTTKFRAENHRLTQFFDELELIEKPVLAAINGPCTGAGGCSRLVKLIGYGKAKELIFTGEMIPAVEAERIGLVNRVVPHDELMSHTRALAEHLLTRAPEALGLAKRILWHSVTSDFATGRMLEALAQSILVKSKDHREGIRAFREKRKPEFKGE
ncbi:MAG TPA: enoyl-CoA hydratase/isomerase family protein [Blastocatellia bacterium]|nr:enoyl-CoA hydratase/isomerase family protein [Blastocatellia bacterium]